MNIIGYKVPGAHTFPPLPPGGCSTPAGSGAAHVLEPPNAAFTPAQIEQLQVLLGETPQASPDETSAGPQKTGKTQISLQIIYFIFIIIIF